MGAPEFAAHFGEIALPEKPCRDEFQGIHQPRNGQLGRKLDQEVHVVVFAVKFLERAAHLGADLDEGVLQVLPNPVSYDAPPVFCDKD